MPDDNQELDASGIGVADMTPEEIDAALAAVAGEAGGENPPPTEPGESATGGAESSASQPLEAAEASASLPPEAPEPAEASDADDTVPPSNSDTEAALDRIDSDLAELESLLAQTSSDGTSIPASLAQAPPPPPEPQEPVPDPGESAETQATAEVESRPTETAGTETAEQDDADDTSLKKDLSDTAGIDDMLLDGSDSLAESSPGADATPEAESDSAAEVAEEAAEIAVEPYDDSPLGVFGMVVSKALLKPLILLDTPFARLRPQAKTAVGLAAVATFLVAVATWVIGCMR
ncbi:MAG: hypothetical protein GX616_22795 [Planctomycetes bacterium]|nr:hypothetical protein [Planctomycetota bacterium]